MKKFSAVLFSIFLFLNSPNILNGQTKSFDSIFLNDFNSALKTGYALLRSPSDFNENGFAKLTGAIVVTGALFTVDKMIKDFAVNNNTKTGERIFQFDKYWGNAYTAALAGGLYLTGLFARNDNLRTLGLKASEAFVFSGIATYLIKVTIGRRRPYAGKSPLFFKPFQFTNNDFHSFPSGHSTVAFAVSTVMANYYKNYFWKIFWFGTATMVAASRIHHNQHWLSDVFAGSALGYFVGRFVVGFNPGLSKHSGSNLSFYLLPNGLGVRFSLY